MAEEAELIRISGLRKAAILLLSLNKEVASLIIGRMDRKRIEEVSRAIAEIEGVKSHEQDRVLEEFYNLAMAHRFAEQGGLGYAQSLLEESLSPEEAGEIMKQVTQTIQQTPFQFLLKTDAENVLTFIQDEHPQTIALILAHLQSDKSAEILNGLSQQKQVEVIKRVSAMDQTNPEVIHEVEAGLEVRLSEVVAQKFEKTGGVESAAEMLNLSDRST